MVTWARSFLEEAVGRGRGATLAVFSAIQAQMLDLFVCPPKSTIFHKQTFSLGFKDTGISLLHQMTQGLLSLVQMNGSTLAKKYFLSVYKAENSIEGFWLQVQNLSNTWSYWNLVFPFSGFCPPPCSP